MSAQDLEVRGTDTWGQAASITISQGKVGAVRPDVAVGAGQGPRVLPGLIDIQVNGFDGHDFNAAGASVESAAGVVRALWRHGVTRFCPTVCTQSREHMIASLRTIARACDQEPWIERAVLGVHVEGPYISPEDGPRGAHPKAHVRPPDWDEVQALQEASGGRVRMVTLAPEMPGAVDLIERLAGAGIVPAIGHTGAAREEIVAAVCAGARISTHLGNGSHAMIPRHRNYIWEQLAQDGLWASMIVDGHHLPPAVVKVFVRAKGTERCILTSDAVWLAGKEPGTYDFLDEKVELTASQGVRLVGTEYLAGSALDLATAVGNVVAFAGVSLADAVAMASERPARLFGRDDLGGLAPGQAGDIVLARWHENEARLEVMQTVVAGEVVYRA
ncbi:MAG: amidohydrolase family protein [Armatimonadetes bacterium]|nr:amidohydrolase family protein [Armatimonadota bacterium]